MRSLSVLILPLALKRLPVAEISLWNVLLFIVSLQTAVDLGFTPTFSRLIALAKGNNQQERIASLYNAMRHIYTWLSVAAFFLLVTAGTYYIAPFWEALAQPHKGQLAWIIVVAVSLGYLHGNRYKAFLEGLNYVPALRRWEILTGLGSAITNLIVLLLHGGAMELIAANQGWALVSIVRNRMLSHHLGKPYIPHRKISIQRQMLVEIWQMAWRSGLGVLFSFATAQVSLLVFARITPVAESASFTTAMRLLQMINEFSQAPFYSKLPRMALLLASGERGILMGVARQAMQRAYWAYVLPWITAGAIGEKILTFIGSKVQFPQAMLWTLLGIGGLLQRHGAMHLHFFTLSNCVVWHIAGGVTGAIFITSVVALVPFVGILAYPLGVIASCVLFYNIYCAGLSYRFWQLRFWQFERTVFLPPFTLSITYLLYTWLIS